MISTKLWRSLLSVPAINQRALEKSKTLAADAIIYDLEDAVAPAKKAEARENLERLYSEGRPAKVTAIRVNPLDTAAGRADLKTVLAYKPDALLLPKVGNLFTMQTAQALLADNNAPAQIKLWAMIETPEGVINAAAIAEACSRSRSGGLLDALIVGCNDLRSASGVADTPGRAYLVPWLMQVVLAGRAYGVSVIDGVYNDFANAGGYERECAEGAAMGFDGKMLIHPNQIEPANRHFSPSPEAIAEATAIADAFAKPGAEALNVIDLDGRMVERLHLEQAEALLAKVAAIQSSKETP